MTDKRNHTIAVLQAVLVTFLWSTSWVLIKFGLEGMPPFIFGGLRYTLAFLIMLPIFLRSGQQKTLATLNRKQWGMLLLLGVVYYTVTQGTQFLGLQLLPAITFSFMLNFSAPLVALLSIPLLKELPTRVQWAGIGVFLIGVLVFFYPNFIPAGMAAGMLVGVISVLATSLGSILGRGVNRLAEIPPLTVTVVSMGFGGILLLLIGLFTEPLPVLGPQQWAIVLWLAGVNTAFAFTLWNRTLRTLSATESSMVNNTMLVQIALLAWLFLDEQLTPQKIWGMAFALVGTLLVNLRKRSSAKT